MAIVGRESADADGFAIALPHNTLKDGLWPQTSAVPTLLFFNLTGLMCRVCFPITYPWAPSSLRLEEARRPTDHLLRPRELGRTQKRYRRMDRVAAASVPKEPQGPTPLWDHCPFWAMGSRAEG